MKTAMTETYYRNYLPRHLVKSLEHWDFIKQRLEKDPKFLDIGRRVPCFSRVRKEDWEIGPDVFPCLMICIYSCEAFDTLAFVYLDEFELAEPVVS